MPTVFISRDISPDNPMLAQFGESNIELIGKSLIEFSRIEIDEIPEADWMFFYSSRGVRFFFEQYEEKGWQSEFHIAAIGPATATAILEAGWPVDFIGEGEPESTAAAFGKLVKNKKVIFPQAGNSRQSIQQYLEGQIQAIGLVVYENVQNPNFKLPVCDALLFTSPMNAQTYFKKYPFLDGQKVAAIGNITAAELNRQGVKEAEIAEQPSEEALLRLALRWYK